MASRLDTLAELFRRTTEKLADGQVTEAAPQSLGRRWVHVRPLSGDEPHDGRERAEVLRYEIKARRDQASAMLSAKDYVVLWPDGDAVQVEILARIINPGDHRHVMFRAITRTTDEVSS